MCFPAAMGDYTIEAGNKDVVLLKTYFTGVRRTP